MVAEHWQIKDQSRAADAWLAEVVRWTWRVKLLTHLETDLLGALREQAEQDAIDVFARNLKDLLLAAPAGQKATIGLDPGLRTGVKLAVVNATGQVVDHGAIFPTPPQNKVREAEATLVALCKKHDVGLIAIGNGTASRETSPTSCFLHRATNVASASRTKHDVGLIAIGNGTASRETDAFVGAVLKANPDIKAQKVMVNEAGASVYSASEVAAKEFPDLDVTIRGAVSIARRLQDPLRSEER